MSTNNGVNNKPTLSPLNKDNSAKTSTIPTEKTLIVPSKQHSLAQLAKSVLPSNSSFSQVSPTTKIADLLDSCKEDAEKCFTSIEKYLKSMAPPTTTTLSETGTVTTQNFFPTIASVIDRAGEIISEHIYSICIGAMLGASVTAGIFCGTYVVSTFLKNSFDSSYFLSLFSSTSLLFKRKSENAKQRKNQSQNDNYADIHNGRTTTKEDNNVLCKILPSKSITMINGTISIESSKSLLPKQQYKECLDNLTISLCKNNLTWKNVVRITVYLKACATALPGNKEVSSSNTRNPNNCSIVFRSLLESYIIDSTDVLVNMLVVQSLENENASIQMEVIATS